MVSSVSSSSSSSSSLFDLSHVQDCMERKKDIIVWVTRKARAGSQGLIGFRLPHDYKYNNTKFRANGKKQRLTARDSYVIQEDLQLEIHM